MARALTGLRRGDRVRCTLGSELEQQVLASRCAVTKLEIRTGAER